MYMYMAIYMYHLCLLHSILIATAAVSHSHQLLLVMVGRVVGRVVRGCEGDGGSADDLVSGHLQWGLCSAVVVDPDEAIVEHGIGTGMGPPGLVKV